MFRVVSVPEYKSSWLSNIVSFDDIQEVEKILETDKYYHSVIDSKMDYMLFFDIDGLEDIHAFINNMIIYLNDVYYTNLTIDDISYTQNNIHTDKYHITIPKIYSTIQEQKNICKNFINKYPEYKGIYDSTVYSNNRLFRLPNQSKGDSSSGVHIIKKGCISDFIPENKGIIDIMDNVPDIDSDVSELDSYMSDLNSESNTTNDSIVHKYDRINTFLGMLNKDRCVNYDDWLHVGIIIKNELGEQGFNIFNKFSKQDKDAYKAIDKTTRKSGEDNVRYKWDTFKLDGSLKLGTLITMAKEDNPILFEKHMAQERKKYEKEEQKDKLMKIQQEIYNIEKEPLKFINRFEDDDFTMVKLLRYIDNTIFDEYIDAYKYLRKNLHRVSAIIGIKSLIIKNDKKHYSDQITFERLKDFGEETLIRIKDFKDSGISLNRFIFTNKHILGRYDNINSKISYEDNNTNEFYITRPYIGKKVKYEISDLDFILEFIKHIVCWDDEEVYNKFMTWLAFMAQYPNEKSGVVPVFISKIGGTGKSKFIEFLAFYVFGRHLYAPFSNVEGALKEQNKQLIGKKFCYVNEMGSTKEEFMSNYQKLKGYITESSMNIKMLYKDPIFMDLYLEFILTANTIDCLPIEKKDRRFFPIRYNNERANDFKYFDLFERTTWNEDYGNKFYSYLLDIKDVNKSTVRNFPITELKQEMLDNATNSFDSFIDDLFNHELQEIINRAIKEDNDYYIACQNLYQDFVDYHKRCFPSDRYIISYRKFISRIKSRDNTYNIKYIERPNGHAKSQFVITLM